MRNIFWFFVLAIIYGSVFPFSFEPGRWTGAGLEAFFATWHRFGSLGDILGNIALFLPFGFFGEALCANKRNKTAARTWLILGGFFLAAALQFLQIMIPQRVPEMSDILWNTVGIFLGLWAFRLGRRHIPEVHLEAEKLMPASLLLLYAIFLFAPFVPTIDLQEIKNSLKPIFFADGVEINYFLLYFAGWLLFAWLGRRVFSRPVLKNHGLPLVFFLSLLARVFITRNYLSLDELLAGLLAILVWYIGLRSLARPEKLLAWLVVGCLLYKDLTPLDFSPSIGRGFMLIPFVGFLGGDLLSNLATLSSRLFYYGALVLLMRDMQFSYRKCAGLLLLLTGGSELLQLFNPHHYAEVTNPLIALLMLWYHRILQQNLPATAQQTADAVESAAEPPAPQPDTPEARGMRPLVIKIFLTTLLLTGAITMVLELPGIPYNVRELFLLDGYVITIFPFALGILWFGMAVPLISRLSLRFGRKQYLVFPALVVGALLINLLLLKISVTEDSLQDIMGAQTLNRDVMLRGAWGDFGVWLFSTLKAPGLISQAEQIVRFVCLFFPLSAWLAIFHMGFDVPEKFAIHDRRNKLKLFLLTVLEFGLYCLPLLVLAKFITFDWSTTDNLNELIRQDGVWSLFLYLLLLIMCLNVILLVRLGRGPLVKGGITLAALVLAWFCLNLGLESEIHKYGQTFSGVDFLLGPDRKILLPPWVLFLRWTIVYLGGTFSLAWGIKLTSGAMQPTSAEAK
ncbi:VanZ family protein [Emcibacter nanhaiensis]|uniref:VanZ family protein n=1 Tax=Emcibacter nanhaiensis TaxID=1505037 RepID=UPI0015E408CA|nr:VanZ family protein [Emcibacter nanhaiensis]